MRKLSLVVAAFTAAGGLALAGPAHAAGPRADEWQYAGKYYTLYDCQQSGEEGTEHGAEQYRCDEIIEPDGTPAYWNLYLLYPGDRAGTAPDARPAGWVDGGGYPLLADCQASGQEAIGHGAEQYRCDLVTYPDGTINYWQLWLLY